MSIGFGIKRAPEREIDVPQFLTLPPALRRREAIPLGPLGAHEFVGLNHRSIITLMKSAPAPPGAGSSRRMDDINAAAAAAPAVARRRPPGQWTAPFATFMSRPMGSTCG